MLKRSTVLALTALAAACGSAPAMAGLTSNALTSNGPVTNFVTLQVLRLTLPDGSEVAFR
jgi:hypothetical protein